MLLRREYPNPRTLPAQPSWQQPRPHLTLSELIPGQYVSATARIAYVKTSERTDALGTKLVFTGMLEDSTFKVPFVSQRITYPLIRNSVYKFTSAYVHEFEDKSLLLVVTEHTKIEPKNIEDYRVCLDTKNRVNKAASSLCRFTRGYHHYPCQFWTCEKM